MGVVCNLLITPVPAKHYMTRAQLDALDYPESGERVAPNSAARAAAAASTAATSNLWVYTAWIPVAIPLLWAVWVTLQKAALIFSHG